MEVSQHYDDMSLEEAHAFLQCLQEVLEESDIPVGVFFKDLPGTDRNQKGLFVRVLQVGNVDTRYITDTHIEGDTEYVKDAKEYRHRWGLKEH